MFCENCGNELRQEENKLVCTKCGAEFSAERDDVQTPSAGYVVPRGFSSKKFIIIIIVAALLMIGGVGAIVAVNVTKSNSQTALTDIQIAERYLSEQNYEQAIIEFEKILEIEPMNVDAYLGLAEAYIGMGDTEKALEMLRKGLEQTGDERLQARIEELTKPVEPEVSSSSSSSSSKLMESSSSKSEQSNIDRSAIPENALEWSGHYYACFNNCSSWEEAEEYCESIGGHLATITSIEENVAVFNYLISCGYQNGYFGYADNVEEGTWYWVNGETSDFTNWHANEPNSERPNEDYAMFYFKYGDGTWNDGNFGNGTVRDDVVFICEWD